MGKVYIKNGTPVGAESLCKTCSWAVIFTGYRESEQTIICTRVDPNRQLLHLLPRRTIFVVVAGAGVDARINVDLDADDDD
jgi:hypothetical protein